VSEQPPAPAVDGYHRGYAPAPRGPERPRRPAHTSVSGRTAAILVTVVVLIAGVALLNLVDVAKVIYRPGPVHDTLGESNGRPVVGVEGVETFPTTGRLDFTTVTLDGGPRFPVSAWDWLLAEVDPSADVVDEEQVYPPDVTAEQVQEQNTELMLNSQEGAAVVALRADGETVPEHILVAQIVVDAPASGVLEINDEIVSVDDTEIATPEDVRDALQEFDPGDTVPFEILRGEEEQSVQVPTGETDERTVIGVYLASEFDLPYEIDIDAGNVGGPSAGLMFALAVYDKITPGAMTGGQAFAGTGTITSAGEVGSIGGIRQKMIAAEQSGADYFLAPADNCDDVRGNEPDGLTVARVETFEQAREIVEGVGAGESIEIPSC
jgi:PDZ domain-containing protein